MKWNARDVNEMHLAMAPLGIPTWNSHNSGLEIDAMKMIFASRDEKFTDRSEELMKLLYETPELHKDISSLGEVADWILEKSKDDDDVVSILLEYGDIL